MHPFVAMWCTSKRCFWTAKITASSINIKDAESKIELLPSKQVFWLDNQKETNKIFTYLTFSFLSCGTSTSDDALLTTERECEVTLITSSVIEFLEIEVSDLTDSLCIL